jgi:XTP/dITP diphosphohydrolase
MSESVPRDTFVCASGNPGKVAEIASLLEGLVVLLPRPRDVPDVVEDADTLIGNARLKAAAICAATGMPAISDDTGLEVDVLDGAPGVHTARFAGEGHDDAANRAKMLEVLEGVPTARRTARFHTVAMVVWPDGRELAVEGVCEGTIATEERGTRGFGYDPLFIPAEGGGGTFAEMSEADKNGISHRGRAMRALVAALRETGPNQTESPAS